MLEAREVTFSYMRRGRRKDVFDRLSWSIPRGKRILLMGPNGAGKTTLLRLLSGSLTPRSGSISVDGSSRRGDVITRVACMPQRVVPLRGVTVGEQVTYATWLRGIALPQAEKVAAGAVERVQLTAEAKRRATELSGGQLRRVGIAEVISSGAEYVLLDEPTAGLDPAQRNRFRQVLNELDPPGSVVVSTHHSDELDGYFDHVVILLGGSIIFDGHPDQLGEFGGQFGIRNGSVEEIFTEITRGGFH